MTLSTAIEVESQIRSSADAIVPRSRAGNVRRAAELREDQAERGRQIVHLADVDAKSLER